MFHIQQLELKNMLCSESYEYKYKTPSGTKNLYKKENYLFYTIIV
jgi:hypothetical protein